MTTKKLTAWLLILPILLSMLIINIKPSDGQTERDPRRAANLLTKGYYVDNPSKIRSFGEATLELGAQEPGVELVERRTPVARHFYKDGIVTAYLSLAPTSFMDEEGQWYDIDQDVSPAAAPAYPYKWLGSSWYGYVHYKRGEWDLYNYQASVDGLGNPIFVGMDLDGFNEEFRGFAQWDLSASGIPSIVTVKDVTLLIATDDPHNPAPPFDRHYSNMEFFSMEVWERRAGTSPSLVGRGSPVPGQSHYGGAGWELFVDAADGTRYRGVNGIYNDGGWYFVDLAGADWFVQQNLYTWSDFMVGFVDRDERLGKKVDRGVTWIGWNTWLRVKYTWKVSYTFATSPSGLYLSLDGTSFKAPKTFDLEVGTAHTISAWGPWWQNIAYYFDYWSDGGAQTHTIVIREDTDITAYFHRKYLCRYFCGYAHASIPPSGATAAVSEGVGDPIPLAGPTAERAVGPWWAGDCWCPNDCGAMHAPGDPTWGMAKECFAWCKTNPPTDAKKP